MPADRRERTVLAGTWILWAVMGVVVLVLVVRTLFGPHPEKNSVTGNFRDAAHAWWAGENLYPSGVAGFLYFPQSAILYTPFTWGPVVLGEVLWRVVCVGLFATGLWRMVRLLVRDRDDGNQPRIDTDQHGLGKAGFSSSVSVRTHPWRISFLARPGFAFLLATLLCLPLAASNLRNGQFNLPLAALMLHAAADLALGRWWRAVLALCLMTALKPLGLVMVLLAAVVYPRASWRLAIGLLAVAALPLIHPSTAYAMEAYRASLRTMESASKVELHHGQDLRGIFAALRIDAPLLVLTAVRLAAAPLMLAIGWLAKRRWGEPAGALWTLAGAGLYLTLFNPRCEGLTYMVLSPVIAGFIIAAPGGGRGRGVVTLLLIVGVVVAISQAFTGGPNSWMRPTAGLVFLGLLLAWVGAGVRRPGALARG